MDEEKLKEAEGLKHWIDFYEGEIRALNHHINMCEEATEIKIEIYNGAQSSIHFLPAALCQYIIQGIFKQQRAEHRAQLGILRYKLKNL